jgi:hypothetical protein
MDCWSFQPSLDEVMGDELTQAMMAAGTRRAAATGALRQCVAAPVDKPPIRAKD